jgi:hypothetical protein
VTNEEVEIRYVIPTSSRSEQIRFCHLLTDYFVTVYVALPQYGRVRRRYQKTGMAHALYGPAEEDELRQVVNFA